VSKKQLVAALGVALFASRAQAWEAQTTSAGLAEQAALSSRLHKRLVTLGFSGGLFEPLTIPPADAPALIQDLHLLSPSDDQVPDARGRQTALGWIAAGAALADVPTTAAANHFYDVATGHGWLRPNRGLFGDLSDAVRGTIGSGLPARGVPAPDWVTDKSNPFSLANFLDQYAKAASAPSPGERSRHMAAALIAAGAILHVLADLGAPSRVRGDEAAHLEPIGNDPDDLGSRFEHAAALAYGRLGIPGPGRIVTREHLRDYFVGATPGKEGLANEIADHYFSPGTLPEPTHVLGGAKPRLVRPLPALPARLNLMTASRGEGATLRDSAGTCLARYKVDHDTLTFSIDDDCVLEQLSAILPEVEAYETGLLDFLLRGELTLTVGQSVVVSGKGFGAGEVEVLVEDDHGLRNRVYQLQTRGESDLIVRVPLPATGVRLVAVFRGADASGEPLVAVGSIAMPSR
jgi:hypothetical protein